jgi:mannan endo-1,4-beta-mannosidase
LWPFLLLTSALCKSSPFLSTPCFTDVLKSQLFPDQTKYFPKTSDDPATEYIGDGGKWVAVHSDTATL